MISRDKIRPYFLPFRRLGGRVSMALGRAGSLTPLSPNFGYSRGTPVDRFYIERFLKVHSADVRGQVLEIGDDSYSRRFGGSRVTGQDVLNLRPGQPGTTIVGDLAAAGTLPPDSFDCIIAAQTLHLVFDIASAVASLRQALRPGGVLLITVPGISPVDRGEWKDDWCWSLTGTSLSRLLREFRDGGEISVSTHGNLFAATAFLHGAAVEEVGTRRLKPHDAAYPVTVTARAVR